mgnify:CR=1 FL=1
MARCSRPFLVAAFALQAALMSAAPARAGWLAPLLALARPQLESSLARQCLAYGAGNDPQLLAALARPCDALARPIAGCLITQTEASGRAMAVITDLIGGRFGEASEVVVKRCLAITLGLPAETFAAVPLQRLAEVHGIRLGSLLSRPALPAGPGPEGVAPRPSGSSAAGVQPSKPEAP